MRSYLEGIVEELKRLKREGVQTVSVSEAALTKLRERAGILAGAEGAVSTKPGTRGASAGAAPAAGDTPAPAPEKLPELPQENSGSASPGPAKRRPHRQPAVAPIPSIPPEIELPEGEKRLRWEALREQVLNCPVCREHVRAGCKVVFGVGNLDATLFFVGEAPGAEEEKKGEPFVGPAGALLDRMIAAMGSSREEVYIGNIMNWRPETPSMSGNRPPTPEEMAFCLPYLRAQIEIVQPRILVALGATAVNGLLGPDPKRTMGKIRGQWHEFSGIPMMITYHPSYVLRYASNRVKRTVWEDLLLVMERAGIEISEKQRRFFLPSTR